jgi:hypothetical protein
MNTIQWNTSEDNTVTRAFFGFGIKDSKGREVGTLLVVNKNGITGLERDAEGKIIMYPIGDTGCSTSRYTLGLTATTYSARSGSHFGSGESQIKDFGTTVEEAKVALIAKAEQMATKARKKAEKNGGIYK